MYYCGIDISKPYFDAAIFDGHDYQVAHFENSSQGIKSFIKWSSSTGKDIYFCMEATGIYHLLLAKFLHQEKSKVAVVNPIKTHGFSKMEMRRNKTDIADARMIARFCLHLHTQNQFDKHLFRPKSKQYEALTALVDRREQLLLLRTEENNRLQVTSCKVSLRSLKASLKFLDKQLSIIEKELKLCQKNNPQIDRQVRLLLTINGIGLVTAWSIVAYMGDIDGYKTSKEVASYAGLNPRKDISGTSVNKSKLSKMGHKKLRKALYFPAIVASKHNPLLKEKYESLLAAGKAKKTAVCAIMRKLLVISYGVLKSSESFDPDYSKRQQLLSHAPAASR